ncbi:TPA: hypothetical protein O6409_000309 [Staphylococcus aureus]|nr:hypothetical protein [Staphylococcus aureus]HDB7867153.1 hypothetical protein [Staphylococcus aureus]HDC3152239.1 hypothetical protein [Staphylococcus aureus]
MNRIEKHAKNTFIILMLIMLFWIFMSFIFQKLLFPPSKNNLTTYEALKYYTHLKGYYGLDHISKGIAYIACVLIPFNFFFRFNDIKKDNNYNNIISTLFLLLYFLVNGISLIIQGFTAEFTISLISESNIHNNHEFAVNLFRYVIQEGGISFSTYLKLILILLFLLSILLVIYQTQSAQILFIFIDFLNFVALILVYLCTNPNNRGIDKIACVK